VEEHPEQLGARFERYLESVATASGLRLETARGQLESGFERMADPLLRSGALDPKSFETFVAVLDRSAERARTLNDLLAAYRGVVADIERAMLRPVSARRDRSLRRAVEYIREHYAEPLSSERVARVAGFTRTYFSKLFHDHERMTFEDYVRALRMERAKQLLIDTDLDVRRVAELSGFSSSQYLSRVFRKTLRTTPLVFRREEPARRRRGRIRTSTH
jgi:two-component system response regulator YesN